MAKCTNINQVSLYHDGELDDATREAFELHMNTCADCQKALMDYRSLSTLVGAERNSVFDSEFLRPVFENRMHDAIHNMGSRSRDQSLFALFAVAALWLISVATFGWYYVNEMVTPDAFAENWVEHILSEQETETSALEEGSDESVDLARWMNRALSKENFRD